MISEYLRVLVPLQVEEAPRLDLILKTLLQTFLEGLDLEFQGEGALLALAPLDLPPQEPQEQEGVNVSAELRARGILVITMKGIMIVGE
jgi:hypothetical protein